MHAMAQKSCAVITEERHSCPQLFNVMNFFRKVIRNVLYLELQVRSYSLHPFSFFTVSFLPIGMQFCNSALGAGERQRAAATTRDDGQSQ